MARVPSLAELSLHKSHRVSAQKEHAPSGLIAKWEIACGKRPTTLPAWDDMRGPDKFKWLHFVASEADDDGEPDGDYVTPYDEIDVDDLDYGEGDAPACEQARPPARKGDARGPNKFERLHFVAGEPDAPRDVRFGLAGVDDDDRFAGTSKAPACKQKPSVGYVVPMSFSNGAGPDRPESDPIGWIVASRSANSRRSNHPLMLWPDPDGSLAPPNRLATFDGEEHYVPPRAQRGRLARKWLFMRATYPSITPPTAAQVEHAARIVALAQYQRVHPAERRVNEWYRKNLGWANPLLEDDAEQWYADPEWRALVFGRNREV